MRSFEKNLRDSQSRSGGQNVMFDGEIETWRRAREDTLHICGKARKTRRQYPIPLSACLASKGKEPCPKCSSPPDRDGSSTNSGNWKMSLCSSASISTWEWEQVRQTDVNLRQQGEQGGWACAGELMRSTIHRIVGQCRCLIIDLKTHNRRPHDPKYVSARVRASRSLMHQPIGRKRCSLQLVLTSR